MASIMDFARQHLSFLPFFGEPKPLVTVLDMHGMIAPGARRGLNFARLEKQFDAAFKPDGLSAIALIINSPGGSPVQSRLIFSSLRRRAAEKNIPILAFIEDVGASGGYILAAAGDEIFADDSSIIGSIGVISAGFGFQDAIARLGIERRIYTAGQSKSQLDPFVPPKEEDIHRLGQTLQTLHEQFIALVKDRRGDKLSPAPDIFTGAFWPAPQALERGLIDAIGNFDAVIRERFGDQVKLKRITPETPSLLMRLLQGSSEGARQAGRETLPISGPVAVDPAEIVATLEERALWSRFGL